MGKIRKLFHLVMSHMVFVTFLYIIIDVVLFIALQNQLFAQFAAYGLKGDLSLIIIQTTLNGHPFTITYPNVFFIVFFFMVLQMIGLALQYSREINNARKRN